MVKRQLAHLKKARLASVEHPKKRKLEKSQSHCTEQLRIDDDQLHIDDEQLDTSDTDGTSDIAGEDTCFWNESESDTEDDGYSDEEESDLGPPGSKTEKEAPLQEPPQLLHWNKEGEKKLRGFYGKGSRATLKRKRKVAKELERTALNRTILALFASIIVTWA